MIALSWLDPEHPSYRRYAAWLGVEPFLALGPGGAWLVSALGERIERLGRVPWERVRGLLLVGGGDVASELSGAAESLIKGLNPERDELELGAVEEALARGLPVLGICRGHQVLNVYFGGTLLNLEERGLEGFHDKLKGKSGSSDNLHWVEVEEGTLLAEIIGPGEHLVNSAHHQAVARVGEGLKVSAWWEGEVIEALEFPGKWLLGVQWHPERLGRPESAALREAFLKEAGLL